MSGDKRVRVIITGIVQGVGFRAWLQGEAERLGLFGWVRNRRDGSVEALLSGSGEVVDAGLKACGIGPAGARVDRLDARPAASADRAASGGGFVILPTTSLGQP